MRSLSPYACRWLLIAFLSAPFMLLTCRDASAIQSYLLWGSTRSEDRSAFYKWTGMEKRYGEQQEVPDSDCGKAQYHPCEILNWKTLLQSIRHKPLADQLRIVNDYANSHPYITDWENWGVRDFWETPFEFLSVSGNCKDYAITKYYSLRRLGVPAEKLRLIVLQDLNLGGIIHAILGVYDHNTLYILDNQAKQVLPASRIYHYRPLYAINEDAWWQYIPQ